MSRICSIVSRMTAVLLLTVALVLVGFGHHPRISNFTAVGQSSTLATPDITEWRLPDGSAPVLCLDGSGETPNGSTQSCDACRLTATSAPPEAPVGFIAVRTAVAADWAQDAAFHVRPGVSLEARPRGPPLA